VFTVSLRKVGSRFKGRLVLKNPTIVSETINGVVVPTVSRTSYASLDLTFDETSTEQERKNTIGMFANALAASVVPINDTFVKLEQLY
jgi:hypothetical protein